MNEEKEKEKVPKAYLKGRQKRVIIEWIQKCEKRGRITGRDIQTIILIKQENCGEITRKI